MRAVAGVAEMRMAVDEARRDPSCLAIQNFASAGESGGKIGLRSRVEDATGRCGNRAFLDDAKPSPGRIERCEPRIAEQPLGTCHNVFLSRSAPLPESAETRPSDSRPPYGRPEIPRRCAARRWPRAGGAAAARRRRD